MWGDRLKGERQAADDVLPEVAAGEIIAIADYEPRSIPSPNWRECIKKVWEVDPLTCPGKITYS